MCHTNGRCALQIVALLGCVCAAGLDVDAQTPAGDRKIVTEANKKDRQVEEQVIVTDPALDKPIGEWAEKINRAAAFPIVCRGGEGLSFEITERPGHQGATIRMAFQPGTGPFSDGLQSGQCTWLDRGFRPSEPRRICHDVSDFRVIFRAEEGAGVIAAFHNTSLQSRYRDYLGDLRQESTQVRFWVFHDGDRCLKVVDTPVDNRPGH